MARDDDANLPTLASLRGLFPPQREERPPMTSQEWLASTYPQTIIQRLYSQTENVGECLLRTGYVRKDGYSLFSVRGWVDYAHRFAYELR